MPAKPLTHQKVTFLLHFVRVSVMLEAMKFNKEETLPALSRRQS